MSRKVVIAMPERKHALLSASSAAIWLNCPAAARLAEKIPNQDTSYSREGTVAHKLAELYVRCQYRTASKLAIAEELRRLREDPAYSPEMEDAAKAYLDVVDKECEEAHSGDRLVLTEHRVDYSTYAPEGFGTADCIIISEKAISVIDFKYGAGVRVQADNNPQLKLYALGAYEQLSPLFGGISWIRGIIVQPRMHNDEIFVTSAHILQSWGEQYVKPRAELAHAGVGECRRGDWCQFCRARPICRKTADDYLALEADRKQPTLADNEIADVLRRAKGLHAWITKLEEYALGQVLGGRPIPGLKAVEGRRTRAWTNQDEALAAIRAAGVPEAMIYDRKPCTLAKLEERLGKAQFRDVAGAYVTCAPGKPILAAADDPRPEYITKSVFD